MYKNRDIFQSITGHDTWCVPSALSALTGISTDVFRCLSLGIEGKARGHWTGVLTSVSHKMMVAMNISFDKTIYNKYSRIEEDGSITGAKRKRNGRWEDMRPTLNQWITKAVRADGTIGLRQGVYLIAAGRHMMLYANGLIMDNGFAAERRPQHHSKARNKRARMNYCYRLDEEQDFTKVKVPAWALHAGSILEDERDRRGSHKTINESAILNLKARYEAEEARKEREEEARRIAEWKARAAAKAKAQREPTPAPTNSKTCKKSGCTNKVLARGFCSGCYKAAKRAGEFGGTTCKHEGCKAIAEAKGYCHRCHHRIFVNPKRYGKVADSSAPATARERAVQRASEVIMDAMQGSAEMQLSRLIWETRNRKRYSNRILLEAFHALSDAGVIQMSGQTVKAC